MFKKENKKNKKIIFYLLVIFFVFSLGFNFGLYFSKHEFFVSFFDENVFQIKENDISKNKEVEKEGRLKKLELFNFDLYKEVRNNLQKYYVNKDDIEDSDLFYGALTGMVKSLGDPYTVFLKPDLSKQFEEDLSGSFEGIGAEIGIRNEILTIISPLEGMPAEKAGLMAGDKIIAIDGTSTIGILIEDAVERIRGEKGTEVALSIIREGVEGIQEIKVKRGLISIKSLKTEIRDDNIFIIKIINFNEDVMKFLGEAIKEIENKKPKGIILDLRNNPGGLLNQAIAVSSKWVSDGIIVSEKYNDTVQKDHKSFGGGELSKYKTLVLVNQGSASASEIVAGALKDHGLAKIIGQKTFGKGSVQSLRKMSDGSSLKITIANWLTPNGVNIDKEGIIPDLEVKMNIDDYKNDKDPQMDKAINILSKKNLFD